MAVASPPPSKHTYKQHIAHNTWTSTHHVRHVVPELEVVRAVVLCDLLLVRVLQAAAGVQVVCPVCGLKVCRPSVTVEATPAPALLRWTA